MRKKKSPKADLEKKRLLFLMIGIAIALLTVYVLLEWSSAPKEIQDVKYAMDSELETEVVVTKSEEPKIPPPLPAPKAPTDILQVTTKKLSAKDKIIVDAGTTENQAIKIKVIEQPTEDLSDEKQVFIRVEQMPQFPGGDMALLKYLGKHLKYPQAAADNDVQGTVYLKFVVEKDGSIGEIIVLRSPDKSLEKEAKRVVASLPKFTPGMQRNTPVSVWYQLPVKFQLQ